jgi:hypothetical protein
MSVSLVRESPQTRRTMPNPHTVSVDLASLLDGSSAGELIPKPARNGLQQLIQLKLAAFFSVDRHERTEGVFATATATALAP